MKFFIPTLRLAALAFLALALPTAEAQSSASGAYVRLSLSPCPPLRVIAHASAGLLSVRRTARGGCVVHAHALGCGGAESEPVNGILHSLASGTKAVDRMESEDGMKHERSSFASRDAYHGRLLNRARVDSSPHPEHGLPRRRRVRELRRAQGFTAAARFLPRHLSGALSSTPPPPSAPPVHQPDHCLRHPCARGRCATNELQLSWIAHHLDSRYLHFRSPSSMHAAPAASIRVRDWTSIAPPQLHVLAGAVDGQAAVLGVNAATAVLSEACQSERQDCYVRGVGAYRTRMDFTMPFLVEFPIPL
ncbi:hypothetical protein DFH08DRAFT_1082830 [Mycena albidolilacea]|uniref:Uncharacterized protein n=1 Tax=Mycena albidolilacea TaxID=1033008 RepID=A0AAD6ZTA3_9AGAR|nr:hypothetical protein DFH08DRAFT_1082830 [Mycena albidolilacea]